MLKSTQQLLEYLREGGNSHFLASAFADSIIQNGDVSDASEILEWLKTSPEHTLATSLFPIISHLGNPIIANGFYQLYFNDQKLKFKNTEEALEVVGKLRLEEAEAALHFYAFESENHYLNKYAVFGLLHFDCTNIQDRILTEIENCYDRNLFPEFTPALVCKLEERTNELEKLYELGDEICSTDCNAGIILGFSLCGNEGLPYFKNAIKSPNWEADSSATGTARIVYSGLKNLGLTITYLFHEALELSDVNEQKQLLWTIFSMIELKTQDFSQQNESFLSLYKELFQPKPEGTQNLFDLAEKFEVLQRVYELESLIEFRIREEIG